MNRGKTLMWWLKRDWPDCGASQVTISAQGYEMQSVQKGEECSDPGKVTHQESTLVKLGEHEFLDVAPRSEDVCDSCMAKHDIYMVKINEDALELIPIDSDWLEGAINTKIVALAAMPDDTDTLTASSKELKAFCRQYADDPEVFKAVGLVFSRN
jgi:hypothetical protein